MAKISFEGIDEYMKKLTALGGSVDKAMRYAVYPAAGYVLDELKASAPVKSGDLRDSIKLAKFESGEDSVYTQIYFDGKDSKGTANSLKARALESGTSKMAKRPFIRPTISRTKNTAQKMMDDKMNEYIQRLMEGH